MLSAPLVSLPLATLIGALAPQPDAPLDEDLARAREILAAPPPVTETMPRLSPDAKRILFVANYDGVPALYERDTAPAASRPRKIAPLPKRLRRPIMSPDGAHLYFKSDEQGNEAYALSRITLATGAVELMTPGDKLRREGPFFVDGGARWFFLARKMSDTGVALLEHTSPGAPAIPVYTNSALDFGALRADGKQLLATNSGDANTVYAIDLAVQSTQQPTSPSPAAQTVPRVIYPQPGRAVSIHDVAYSADGKRAFIATDDGGERAVLLAVDVKSGRELARYTETGSAAGKIQELQSAGDRVAFVVDAGVRHDVRVLDARTLRPIALSPPLPLGSGVPGAMHPNSTSGFHLAADGKRAVLQWSTPTSPPRVYVIDTRSGATAPLTQPPPTATAAANTAPAGGAAAALPTTSVVEIESFDGTKLPTLLYLPAQYSASAPQKRPVIVQMHGGFPFASTARYDARIARFLDEGYVVVEPNVRGSGGFGRAFERSDDGVLKLNALRDLRSIVVWVAAHPWADERRLAIMGGSAGGYWTLLGLEHDPEWWACGIASVPIYDVAETIRTTDGDLRVFWEQKELVPLSEPMLLSALSPSTFVERIRAPLFVYAGARDARTPVAQIDQLVARVRGNGGTVEYMRSDIGHAIDDPKLRAELMARTLRFLRTRCVR